MNSMTRAMLVTSLALGLSCAPLPAVGGIVLDLANLTAPTLLGSGAEDQFGYSSASGDVDGDGAPELIVGAPGHAPGTNDPHTGAVYVFDQRALTALGSASTGADVASRTIRGATRGERFGAAVAAADVDGDGISDIVVGAPSWDAEGRIACGRVYVFKGGAVEPPDRAEDAADVTISGNVSGDCLGSSIVAGFLDDDALADIIVSAPGASGPDGRGAGAVYVITGATLAQTAGQVAPSDVATAVVQGERAGDALIGLALADTNGDGTDEAILGACQADGPTSTRVDVGKVYLLARERLEGQTMLGPSATIAVGPKPRGLLGRSIAVGDVDSDGCDDVVVSAYTSRGQSEKEDASGEAFLIFGKKAGFTAALDLSTASVPTFRSRSRWDLLGLPVLCADVSGDGTADIIIAAQFSDSPRGSRRRCGEVTIFRGGLPSVLRAKAGGPELADVTIVGATEREALGGSLLAAHLIGDPKADLAVGAPDASGPNGDPRQGKLYVIAGERLLGR
jgi:hypothetical protein